jgi:DNA repair protein RadD
LTKGFNAPCTDLIALLTATKSTGKYVQMIGRGLRISPGKTNCLVLDFGGNVLEHGPIDDVNPNRTGKGGKVPMKHCPKCQTLVYCSVTHCPECGYEFPRNDEIISPGHDKTSYSGAIMSDDIAKEGYPWLDVRSVLYSRHYKEGSPDSVKVTFRTCAGQEYYTWLCLDHRGFACKKALDYVEMVKGSAVSTDEALEECWNTWIKPSRIQVKKNGKFFEIVNYEFKSLKDPQQSLI